MEAFAQIQEVVASLAASVAGSVVTVGRGAGMVVAPGRVLTNAHNVAPGGVEVVFAAGRSATGELAAADVDGDLAVVAVDTGELPPVSWAEVPPELGAPVFAVGPPRGGPGRITFGMVCAVDQPFRGPSGRRLEGVEHTAPVGRGSSGGPLVDAGGQVVGIDTHRRGGFYLALPVDTELRERVDRLARGEAPATPRLGVAISPPDVARRMRAAVGLDEREGLLIREVDPDGAAARAGVRAGDLVVAADGTPVRSADELLRRVTEADGSLVLTLLRGVDEIDIRVSPGGGTTEEGSA